MPRITRISGSFVIVLIAYWAYALMIVPWIEPPVDLKPLDPSPTAQRVENVNDLVTLERRNVQDLFQPGDWEITSDKTKVLKSDKARLLLQEYKNLGQGRVEIRPCTVVFDYDGAADTSPEQRHRQSIILQAPLAVLEFDRPVDIRQPRDANLIGGELTGNVVIRSDWKEPGPADDLRITTSNVHLTKDTIATSEPVNFRWGPHFGSGQDLLIKLMPGKRRPGAGVSGLNVIGIQSFELRHIERLHLEVPPENPEKGTASVAQNGSHSATPKTDPFLASTAASTPIEVACRGPFLFDVVGRVATFNDAVSVERPNPTGDPDRLTGDVLAIKFIERPTNKPPAPNNLAAKKGPSMDLTPQMLEARGNPVRVTAPSKAVTAEAQRMEYDLLAKTLTLDGEQPVFLQQAANEIHARNLFYQAAADKARMGQVVAQGPGWLHGQSADDPKQQVDAIWQNELKIQPHNEFQIISLLEGADVRSKDLGQLQAKNIYLWLLENPSAPKGKQLKPHGLRAEENVRFNSKKISGKDFEQLEVWFEDAANLAAVNPAAASAQPDQAANGAPSMGAFNGPPIQQPSPSMTLIPQAAASPDNRPQHFEVTGRAIRARVLYGIPEPTLTDLAVEDRVQLVETQTPLPEDRPVLMRGDSVVVNNSKGTATILGTSQTAHFEGRGLGLSGANINVERGPDSSRLWIDGPGQMDVLIDKDLEKRPLRVPSTLTINWQGGMHFDGQTAKFAKSVVAATPGIPSEKETMTEFHLNTSEMFVRLQQPIRFGENNAAMKNGDQQIESIQCVAGVDMESRSFDNRRQLVSHDRMQLTDLAVNRITGALNGGPGTINTVRHGSGVSLMDSPLAASNNAPTNRAPTNADQLFCMHVTYQGPITGNVNRHDITFHDQVHVVCGPVDNWDAVLTTKDPEKLGPDGAVAKCEELRVVQMPQPGSDRKFVELLMAGNAVIEGTTYRAVGHRISYAEAKELFIIEGDGRTPAELFRQMQVGGQASRLPAQKILYWRKTKDVQIGGAQMLEVQLPDGKKR